jgi:hypothetical protein
LQGTVSAAAATTIIAATIVVMKGDVPRTREMEWEVISLLI